MDKETAQKWKQQFVANYEGKSPEAKEIEPYLKKNYKGNDYIPWATMERLTMMQDPEATFSVLLSPNPYGSGATSVHTFSMENRTLIDGKETIITMFSHFVRVSVTFLGVTFTEDYPVQDKAYDAPKIIDQNLVNKALQRAKAKVASRATGLGFKLYEGLDLQFEEEKPAVTVTATKVVEEKGKETPSETKETTVTVSAPAPVNAAPKPEESEIQKFANFIHNNESLREAFQKMNTSVAKKYGFTFDITEPVETIAEKLGKVANAQSFFNVILKNAPGVVYDSGKSA